MIGELVTEDADQPGLLTGPVLKSRSRTQGGEERFLHKVFGNIALTNPRQRVTIQDIAMILQPSLPAMRFGIIHVAHLTRNAAGLK